MSLCARRPRNLFLALAVLVMCAPSSAVQADHHAASASDGTPASPKDFAVMYGEASASFSAEAVASFYGETVVSIAHTGTMRTMAGKPQQVAELAGFYTALGERGITSLNLADYTVIELSNEFALSRMRWELADSSGAVRNTVMSTYVIRREAPGWRVVSILEMGRPTPPARLE